MVGLYPHILHEQGLQAKKRYLDKQEDQLVSKYSLYKLAKIILKRNYFRLKQNTYHRILSTVICRKFAPQAYLWQNFESNF